MQPPGLVVPVLGAGVSESAGLSGSRGLASALLSAFDQESAFADPERLLATVVDFLLQAGTEESDLLGFVAGRLSAEQPTGSPLVEGMIRVPSRFIVTLNFDLSIEAADRRAGGTPVTLGNGRADLGKALRILAAGSPPSDLTVLHLHGSVESPAGMVHGAEGYARVYSDLFGQALYELAVHRVLAFYGTTLDEPYFLARFQAIPNRGSHVLWCREDDRRELTGARNPILVSRSNIYIGTVEHYENLPATLASVLGEDAPAAPRVAPARVLRPDPGYVTNSLRDRRDPNDPEDLAFVSFGLEPRGDVHADPTEDNVLDGLRTIIVGDPGTGKSELLRALAARSKRPRTGLFIRLADVGVDEGLGPLGTLSAWAKNAHAAGRGVDVGPAALESGRFHFFLDGLDEVDSSRHDELAKEINRLAAGLPQHAFTVSTRPLAGLELLRIDSAEASDWSQYALVPDKDWRDRYLARRGVTLDALLEQMPALRDMQDVLVTPFFLRHIVDLHEEGRLGGQRDIGDLLASLIDAAVARDHGTIELPVASIGRWLRDIALAATISGTRTFRGLDLNGFPFPGDAGQDPVALARDLEHRLLIAEDSGNFRFHHRLLGEQLAAEGLVESGPAVEILDCLVPYIDDDLTGVRPDAAVTVGLACLRSRAWRTAVAERDARATARATPRDASVAERSAALRTLWDAATEAQVWVWDHGPGLTDDAEAMVRLVRGLPGSRVVREMRRALHAGTDQDQGNAIRILSRALPDGLEAALRKVLRDQGRNGVVLRQAALAASECGFLGLIDDITGMLVARHDHAVHQDGIIALRRLMGSSPRPDVYRRLMAGPEADCVLAAVHEELDPADLIPLLADYLGQGGDTRELPRRLGLAELFAKVPPEDLPADVHGAAVRVALLADLDRKTLRRLKEADPASALWSLAEALDGDDGLGWYQVLDLAILYSAEELREAGVDEEVIARTEQRRAVEAEGDSVLTRAARESLKEELPPEDDEDESPPTLGDLLADPQSDANILRNRNAEYFAPQVPDLDDAQLAELRSRLARWWPDKPFRSTITVDGPNAWRQEWKAAGWIWLGPAARPPLSPYQWGQLAACGILFSAQSEWLQSVQTLAGIYEALDAIGSDGDLDRWAQLFECCAAPLPSRLFVRCADVLDPDADTGKAGHLFRIAAIARRFVDADRVDLAQKLSARSETFAAALPPLIAEGGDVHAQAAMLGELSAKLDLGELPEDDRMNWMGALSSPSLLPGLFGILRQTYRLCDEPSPRVTVGYGSRDLVNPTIEAIGRVGGRGAVAGYDELVAEGGDFHWLLGPRDRVAANELIKDGERFRGSAATRAGLPLIDGDPDS
jgi:SIR2-like domain